MSTRNQIRANQYTLTKVFIRYLLQFLLDNYWSLYLNRYLDFTYACKAASVAQLYRPWTADQQVDRSILQQRHDS